MWNETQQLLISAHRRMLRMLKERGTASEDTIDRLIDVVSALNGEGVVYLGCGHYEQAPYLRRSARGGGK